MVSGVTKGRLGWQFMLETFMMTVPGWAIGLIAGALLAKPLGTAWAGGQSVAITSVSVWNMIWYGLGACLVLGIIAFMRVGFFDLGQLFAGRSDDSNESAEAKNADEPEETVESTERTEVNA